MSQASFWRKQLNNLLESSYKTKFQSRIFQSVFPYRFLLLGLGAIACLFLWNWKLVLATVAGVGLMLLVYLLQGWNWQVYWWSWRRFFTGSNRKLTIAVGSGGIAAFTTYLAASLWANSSNRWLATSNILQGFGTLITLVLLLWHVLTHQTRRDDIQFEDLTTDLTAKEPLKQLIAVRQLTQLVSNNRLSKGERDRLLEYFRLMLSQEQEPVIRNAILHSLQMWETQELKEKEDRPLKMPISLKTSLKKSKYYTNQ